MICALSGGVDSTVAATLVHKVLGDRLHCVFVDNGLLRYKVSRGYSCAPAESCLSREHCLTPLEWHLAACRCLPLPNACLTATHYACKTAQMLGSPAPWRSRLQPADPQAWTPAGGRACDGDI